MDTSVYDLIAEKFGPDVVDIFMDLEFDAWEAIDAKDMDFDQLQDYAAEADALLAFATTQTTVLEMEIVIKDALLAVINQLVEQIKALLDEALEEERRKQRLIDTEAMARQQPGTSNWAKAQLISFEADGVAVEIRPNGDWSTNVVSSASHKYPVSTTEATAKIIIFLPLVGKQEVFGAVTSVEKAYHSDGDANITNEVTFMLQIGDNELPVIVNTRGDLSFYPSNGMVQGYTYSNDVKVGEDDICGCGDSSCVWSTTAPTYNLKEITVS